MKFDRGDLAFFLVIFIGWGIGGNVELHANGRPLSHIPFMWGIILATLFYGAGQVAKFIKDSNRG